MSQLTDQISLRAHLGDPSRLSGYLSAPGVVRTGHFRLLSGLHTDRFLAFSRVAGNPGALRELAGLLAPNVSAWSPTVLLAPSTAGVALGGALADELGLGLHLASLDRSGRPNGVVGEPDLAQARVLLVNDVVTTGQGLAALAALVRDRGGSVAGASWFASRTPLDVSRIIDAPAATILSIDLSAVSADKCPACADEQPIEDALDLN